MAQILDGSDPIQCGADKFIQLFVAYSTDPPIAQNSPKIPKEEKPQQTNKTNCGQFGLFKQQYRMLFEQKGIIYRGLDSRLLKRKGVEPKEANSYPIKRQE